MCECDCTSACVCLLRMLVCWETIELSFSCLKMHIITIAVHLNHSTNMFVFVSDAWPTLRNCNCKCKPAPSNVHTNVCKKFTLWKCEAHLGPKFMHGLCTLHTKTIALLLIGDGTHTLTQNVWKSCLIYDSHAIF